MPDVGLEPGMDGHVPADPRKHLQALDMREHVLEVFRPNSFTVCEFIRGKRLNCEKNVKSTRTFRCRQVLQIVFNISNQ